MNKVLIIGLFGLLGVLTRYAISELVNRNINIDFPIATLFINSVGSLLIGLCAAVAMNSDSISSEWYAAIVVGFLGGFTTFSAFSLDALRLFGDERPLLGLIYLFGSPCLGLAAAAAGIQIGKILVLAD